MKKILFGAIALALGAGGQGFSQSLEELNVQIHGYATQGFLYTTQNNIFTTQSSNGSPAWTEAVINIGAEPVPKLRIAAQGRFFLLGNFGGNTINLDWAAADYKVDDRFGVRFGKVKTPVGLFNEIQDIDPSYMWALLPQSIYPITSRNSQLSHYGGVVYGTVKLSTMLGRIEYRGWAGERSIPGNDGYLVAQTEAGVILPNGVGGLISGAAVHWRPPLRGLMVGASDDRYGVWSGKLTAGNGALSGTESSAPANFPNYFALYEKGKIMVAGEYGKQSPNLLLQFNGLPPSPLRFDDRQWYAMASYKVTSRFTAGAYDSQQVNRLAALGPARYSKDWTISGRYDFGQYIYAKVEEHFIDGTSIGYDTDTNPNGLKPNSKLTILKAGVSF